ncbi:hypothetical protein SSS_03475 [Sarcoptes scabiei]|uniref:Cyclic AMP-dependent transcription factor ATF-6 alpha n=1 Tax=Sarcoptes scabiei TaxID=52283 RepID=A0A834VED9_SARSC|nr:hypothetical protein SSS_03475 [Sarcoptes scabiei]
MVDIDECYILNEFSDGNMMLNQSFTSPFLMHQNHNQITDYLESIESNDLFRSDFEQCLEKSSFHLNTPPETPVNQLSNHNNHSPDSQTSISTINLQKDSTDNFTFEADLADLKAHKFLDFNSNYDQSNSFHNNFGINGSDPIIIDYSNDLELKNIDPFTSELASPASIASSSSSNNSQTLTGLSSFTLNEQVLPAILQSKKPIIQPKIILPNINGSNQNTNASNKQKEISRQQKLEARKLRNREAALNSRMKKKEYIDNLEIDLKRLRKENIDLMLENSLLKQKISDLENELFKFKNFPLNNSDNGKKKATISLFAVTFLMIFQFSPYLPLISHEKRDLIKSRTLLRRSINETHHSRNLLWSNEAFESSSSSADLIFEKRNKLLNVYNSSRSVLQPKSANSNEIYYNQTELKRMDTELRDWLTHFKLNELEMKRRYYSLKSKKTTKKLLFDLKHVPIPRLKLWLQKQKFIDYINEELVQNHFDFDANFDYENLMSSIHRRDDTFYYFSYPSNGHLILPPQSNRTNVRPRFSILIPTTYNFKSNSLNKTKIRNETAAITALPRQTELHYETSPQLYLLQIDCQVINTKVITMNHEHFVRKANNSMRSIVAKDRNKHLSK